VVEGDAEFNEKITMYTNLVRHGDEYHPKQFSMSFKEDLLKGGKSKPIGKVDINLSSFISKKNSELVEKSFPFFKNSKDTLIVIRVRAILIRMGNRKILSEVNEKEAKTMNPSKIIQRGIKFYVTETEENMSESSQYEPSISDGVDFVNAIEDDSVEVTDQENVEENLANPEEVERLLKQLSEKDLHISDYQKKN